MVIYRPLQVKATSKGPDNWNKRNIKQSVFFKFNSKKGEMLYIMKLRNYITQVHTIKKIKF